jgi:FkbH-like protein
MLLKVEDFAGMRINWQDKATNVHELAEEFNLGVDSFVFLDDSPVERDWMRHALPGVCVPDLPADPAQRPSFIRQLAALRRIALTDADRTRAEKYAVQSQRAALASAAGSLEEFLAALDQEVTIEPLQTHSIARAAQMCQRTNQFNLTTRRYSAADLETMVQSTDTEAYVLAVRDRFGDNGITGLGILRMDGDTAEVDSLLLSCRVLGRRIEKAFLHVLAERARERGMRRMLGRYVPTAKNAQVATFYAQHGFEPAGDGLFSFDLAQSVEAPGHIAIKLVTNV